MTPLRKIRIDKLCTASFAVLLVLCIKHYGDVRAGALETGDGWLVGNYLLLSAVVLSGAGALGWLFLRKRSWSLERIYIICSLGLGLLYLCVLPPLSAPDEVSHYISAYQLSNRMMGKNATHEDGHVLIRSRDIFAENVYGEAPGKGEALGHVLEESTYRLIREQGFFGGYDEPGALDLEGRPAEGGRGWKGQPVAVSVQPPVRTMPLVYLPSALGITAARLLDMSCVGLLYMGRLFNLLFYVLISYLAIRRLPFGKEAAFGVSLLPMTLHLSASMSYDVMILSLMGYFTACCLDLAFVKNKARVKDVAVLAAVMAVAGPCKMVYAVLMGFCLLIPVYKFGGWKGWGAAALCVLAAFGISMAAVNSQAIVSYALASPEAAYVPWAEEPGYSLSLLLHNPGLLIKMFYNTIVWQAEYYHLTMAGAYLGNIDEVLDVPYLAICLFTAGLLALALRKPGESIRFTMGQRIWIWVVCFGCGGAVLLSMLIAWTPLSSPVISGVQGRYFLPFLPIFLMTLKNNIVVMTRDTSRTTLFFMCCANGYALLRLFSIVSMRV